MLLRVRDPESFDVFLIEAKGKPEAAIRAAVGSFFALNLPGIDQRAAQILTLPTKETKETREMQESVRRVLLEAPLTGGFAPLIWQLAMQKGGPRSGCHT